MMSRGCLLVAETFQSDGDMCFRLAIVQLVPILACLTQEVVHGFFMFGAAIG